MKAILTSMMVVRTTTNQRVANLLDTQTNWIRLALNQKLEGAPATNLAKALLGLGVLMSPEMMRILVVMTKTTKKRKDI